MKNNESNKPPKKEVKKLEDMLPFNPFVVLGLRPKPLEEKYKKYAGLNIRMIATTIDTTIAAIFLAPALDVLFGGINRSGSVSMEEITARTAYSETPLSDLLRLMAETGKLSELMFTFVVQTVALMLASAICWKIWSSTPGKMLFGLKIVDAQTQQQLSNKQIILRTLGYIPSCTFFFLGIFWISFNKMRQGWHDKIAGTVVIKVSKKATIEQPQN